ncbi:MAG: LysM peptidoglycan-binding protein [Microbacteriaceae bacterium]|nr:LysM peptidoglycan-binding protein [Microbacteriaceae bacterium]
MTNTAEQGPRHVAPKDRSRIAKGMLNTIPIVLVGTLAMSLNVATPIDSANAQRADKPKATPSELGKTIRSAFTSAGKAAGNPTVQPVVAATAASAPASYRVAAGDTVSSIAGRYGIATASVLALNGLGWKSIIFPGQVLKLTNGGAAPIASPAAPQASNGRYTIMKGDTVGSIAKKFGISTQTVLSANGLGWSSIIYPGQTLAIPTLATSSTGAATAIAPVAYVTPSAPAVVPVKSTVSSSYVIKAGDTISKIATQFGVSIQSILNANNMTWSSLIYSGRSITIPGVTVITTAGSTTTGLTTTMAANASIIIGVGKSLGVSDYGLVIALSAAMQESSLQNLNYGDRDSLGLFQQRPSAGWGTPAQLTNTTYASKLFFGGPSNPNRGITNGLLDIPGWQSMTVTQAAQAVQKSAYPDAYAKWEASAWVWLDLLT